MELDFTNNQPPKPSNQPIPPPQPLIPPPARPASSGQPLPPVNQAPSQPPSPPPPNLLPPPGPPIMPVEAPKSRAILIIILVGLLLVAGGVGAYLVLSNRRATPPPEDALTTPSVDPLIKNRDDQRKTDLAQIQKYLEAYRVDHQSYPLASRFQRFDDLAGAVYTALVPQYSSAIPLEPLAPSYWYGYQSTDGTNYELTAQLEDQNDPEGAYDTEGNFLYRLTPTNLNGTISTSSSDTNQ